MASGSERGAAAYRETPHERRLAARFQAGEAEALSGLFDLHVDRVYAYARHLLGNREDAEEVVSEAFLRAFERAASFRGECPFRGWLFAIARNLCSDRRRQPRLLLLDSDEAERQGDGGRQSAQMETGALVRRIMADMSEEYRVVLTLCDVEQWDAREVAAMLDKSLPATKSMLYRARQTLRAQLTAHWAETEDEDEPGEDKTESDGKAGRKGTGDHAV